MMVGEIRDLETAEIAVQASLTGHLVLSTLHTNTAIGAVTRLQDMGVEPFLLSSSLLAVMAQRLVRLLCPRLQAASRSLGFRAAAIWVLLPARRLSPSAAVAAVNTVITPATAVAPAFMSLSRLTTICAC